jgi:uncharacterized LabA/DUF88 family protein
MNNIIKKSKKINVYIDGFNLYFGMRAAGFDHCKWLDVYALSVMLKNDDHNLNVVKYFTARVSDTTSKGKRQSVYIDALMTTPVQFVYGQYRPEEIECYECFNTFTHSKEKMTDVNIATHMIVDAYKDEYDVALLISGDSDLVPPVKAIKELFPNKEILVAFPPLRESNELRKCADSVFVIGKKKIEQCLLPNEVENKYAFKIKKPKEWP